jgi:hypothetical protein
MRTLPLISLFGLSFGCTRDNPAFGDEAGDGPTETGGDTTTTTDTDASTDASTDDATTVPTDESTDAPEVDMPGDVCEGELRGGLSLGFADPYYFQGLCPDAVQMHGQLHYDPVLQTVTLNRCYGDDVLCLAECGYEQHPIAVDFDVSAYADNCVSVVASKPLSASEDMCSWGTLAMFPSDSTNAPLVVATTAGTQPGDMANAALGGYPSLTQTSMCDCESFAINDPCCTQSFGVLFFAFVLPDQSQVAPGESAMIEQLGVSPYQYEFKAAQAQRIGDCGVDVAIDTSWALTAKF